MSRNDCEEGMLDREIWVRRGKTLDTGQMARQVCVESEKSNLLESLLRRFDNAYVNAPSR